MNSNNLFDTVLAIAEEELAKEFSPEQIAIAKKKHLIGKIKELIHGIEYRSRLNPEAIKLAKENNIVILYGASDDLMELEGAIGDEVYAYDGLNYDDDFDLGTFPEEVFELMKAHKLELVWCPDEEKSWAFKVSENSTFERFNIMEDGSVFCEGLILAR